jgi:hypothetical protein
MIPSVMSLSPQILRVKPSPGYLGYVQRYACINIYTYHLHLRAISESAVSCALVMANAGFSPEYVSSVFLSNL